MQDSTARAVSDDAEEILTEPEAALMLRVPLRSLRKFRMQGKGPGFYRVSGKVRYRRSTVRAWVAAQDGGQ